MKYFFSFFYYICLTLLMMPGTASALDATSNFTHLFLGLRTYQASFEQMTYNAQGTVIQKGRGRVMIKRPQKFYWEVETPTHQITIINGQILWLYDVDLAEATKQSFAKNSTNPASLLTNSPQDIAQHFVITENRSQNQVIFTLRPKSNKEVSFSWVQLQFMNKQLVGMAFQDHLDQKNVFRFSNIHQNLNLPDHLFEFKPPPHVDVINDR